MKICWLFLLLTVSTWAQQARKYPALLWKISGNGLREPSYLYGTMHVSNRVAYYLSEEFFEALRSVEVVGLETNPGEWLQNMERTGELAEMTQFRDQGFTRNFYRSAFALAFPDKRVFQGMLSYDPDIINGLLYRQDKSRQNFEESTYIDLFIYQTASKLKKQVISLEDFATSEIKARLSALPDNETGSENQRLEGFGNAQRIEDAYREGNLDVLDSLSRLSTTGNMQKYLISDRNLFFAKTIDSVMRTASLFSGVGAAHLPGEDGVIELLRKKGYNVQPVEPSISKKSNREREELDQQVMPVSFSRQFAEDTLFSVELPGRLFKIIDAGQLKYFIHADMVNGSFYTIARLRHMGALFNVSAGQVRARVDSLLFEYIPGRILQRNDVAKGSIKGIEVHNRTRTGDEQWYQIFFTAEEMVLFKVGGKHTYAGSADVQRFFQSISFAERDTTPEKFDPPAGGFTVTIPGNYHYEKNDYAGIAGISEDLFVSVPDGAMGVRHAVYNDFTYIEEDTFELNQLASGVLDVYGFPHERSFVTGQEQGFPVISFSGRSESGRWLGGKIFIRGVHYYLVYTAGKTAVEMGNSFFNSFRLTDFRHLHPLKQVTDPELEFTAIDEVTDDARSRFNERYSAAYKLSLGDTISAPPAYGYRAASKYYYSPSTNEYISISFEKYNDYDYRNSATMAGNIESTLLSGTTMFILDRETRETDRMKDFRYVLADTGSARVIAVRVIFAGNRKYELVMPYDSATGMKGWARGFFESFSPVASEGENSLFVNRFPQMLEDLAGSDTTKRGIANRTLAEGLGMQPEFNEAFISFVSGPAVSEVNEDSRAQLFVNGGTLGEDRIIEPYRKLYMQYTDSFYLQLCLLKGLAYLQTPAGVRAFGELIVREPPLVGDEHSVNDVFMVLRDSLPLCRQLFPGLLALTRYEEFRNPVYSLLADLTDQRLIPASRYSKQRDAIISDALLALKRYNPAVRSEREQNDFGHLDRQTRELAESIRKSLEGLAGNMQHQGEKQALVFGDNERHPLVSYAYILAPFYARDEKVRQFFTRLSKVKAMDIQLPVTVSLLRQHAHGSDSMVSVYSADPLTRAYFFSELEKHDLTNRFDRRFLSQKKLIESLLISQRQLNALYGYERPRAAGDSLVLIREIMARNKYQQGRLFLFRSGRPKIDEQWSAVFVPGSDKGVSGNMELLSAAFYPDPSKSEEQNINELLVHFRLSYRKRALVNPNG